MGRLRRFGPGSTQGTGNWIDFFGIGNRTRTDRVAWVGLVSELTRDRCTPLKMLSNYWGNVN